MPIFFERRIKTNTWIKFSFPHSEIGELHSRALFSYTTSTVAVFCLLSLFALHLLSWFSFNNLIEEI